MFSAALLQTSTEILERYRHAGLRIVTAESCTGGLVAAALTAIAGSSDVIERGFVTYTNEAKEQLLGVPRVALLSYGAVSEMVARAMAEGALHASFADVAVSVTGIAGPGGATADKPLGLVHFGLARRGRATVAERHVFAGNRDGVREAALERALSLLLGAVA
jgi:nicotinamide-nucleotide amidase